MKDPVEASDHCFEHGCQMMAPGYDWEPDKYPESTRSLLMRACHHLAKDGHVDLAYQVAKRFNLKCHEKPTDLVSDIV